MTKEIKIITEITKGQQASRLQLARDLTDDSSIRNLFETIKCEEASKPSRLFDFNEKIVSTKTFKATLIIEIID
ncbi:MAG: hypothetical protein ACPGSG_11470 [Prolixibacteraceae bacterium]